MATMLNDLRAFHEFVGRKLAEAGDDLPTPEECLDLWLIENQTPEEQAETLEELRREIQVGIEQADRGELGPMDAKATLENVRARRGSEG